MSYCMVLFGIFWYCMVLYGMACKCMVQGGIALMLVGDWCSSGACKKLPAAQVYDTSTALHKELLSEFTKKEIVFLQDHEDWAKDWDMDWNIDDEVEKTKC